jgi:hypothetical protein
MDELMEKLKPRGLVIRIVGGIGPHPDAIDVPPRPETVTTVNDRGVDVHESPQMAALRREAEEHHAEITKERDHELRELRRQSKAEG